MLPIRRPFFRLRLSLSLSLSLVLCGLLCLVDSAALAADRIALVIGNAAYPAAPLKNPVNDATDMAAALKRLGFEVTLLTDAGMRQMEDAVREFGLKLRKGGTGLFYFAGHGLQVAGENYLVPVNAQIQSEGDVKYGCLNAGLVLAKMEDAGNGPNVVILDACRNNPFARSFRSAEAGLARMDAPTGSIIAYATAPGRVAADGEGRNGLYTQHLLKHIGTSGLSVTDLFMSVREGVVRDSGKKQVPWENTSLIGRFSFAGQAAAPTPAPTPAPAPQAALAPKPAPQPQVSAATARIAPLPTPEEEKLLAALRDRWLNLTDSERVRRLAQPLAAKGSAYGVYALGWLDKSGRAQRQATERAASLGVALAMVDQANFLAFELGSPEDQAEARSLLQRAAGQGEPWAKLRLGDLLIQGKGGPRDVATGERLLAEVMRENPNFCGEIGSMYFQYKEVLPAAEAEAKGLAAWKRGAGYGEVPLMLRLANRYWLGGFGSKSDRAEAYDWYSRAAAQGNAEGMVGVASMLFHGAEPAMAKNQVAAAEWFRKAGEAGSDFGASMWAQCHIFGTGVPEDVQRGLAILKSLADKGNVSGQAALGRMHEVGHGVPKDLAQAYFWYVVADAKGSSEGAVGRESLAEKLPANQRAAIEARAANWRPKKK